MTACTRPSGLAVHGSGNEREPRFRAGDAVAVFSSVMMTALPDWARELAGECPVYAFAPCDVFRCRAVAAVRMSPGTGPYVVISSDEREMRTALGLAGQAGE